MTVRDDICRALSDAIGWQMGLVAAYSHIDGSTEATEALAQAARYRSILRRRYGISETVDERIDRVSLVNINDLLPTPAQPPAGERGDAP